MTKSKPITITEVVKQACIDVKARKGYDVNIAEGRAFNRAFWRRIIKMPKSQAVLFIARCLKHYDEDVKK